MKNKNIFKKSILMIVFVLSILVGNAIAEDGKGILSNIILDKNEVKSREFHKDALKDAQAKISEAMDKNDRKKIEMENALVETMGADIVKDKKKLKKAIVAPVGLYWGYGYDDLISMGVDLTLTDRKNIYSASKVPTPLKDFGDVKLDFSDDDKLWQIFLTGKINRSDANGANVLKAYRRYKSLLTEKYGEGKEFFNTIEREVPLSEEEIAKLVAAAGGEKKVKDDNIFIAKTKKIKEGIGGPNFVKDLSVDNASLYVVFDTEMLNIQLVVGAVSDEITYLSITYRSKVISDLRDKETMEIL